MGLIINKILIALDVLVNDLEVPLKTLSYLPERS